MHIASKRWRPLSSCGRRLESDRCTQERCNPSERRLISVRWAAVSAALSAMVRGFIDLIQDVLLTMNRNPRGNLRSQRRFCAEVLVAYFSSVRPTALQWDLQHKPVHLKTLPGSENSVPWNFPKCWHVDWQLRAGASCLMELHRLQSKIGSTPQSRLLRSEAAKFWQVDDQQQVENDPCAPNRIPSCTAFTMLARASNMYCFAQNGHSCYKHRFLFGTRLVHMPTWGNYHPPLYSKYADFQAFDRAHRKKSAA